MPDYELVPDPMSELDNYSDAKYLHRFKWMSEDDIKNTFGNDSLKNIAAYRCSTKPSELSGFPVIQLPSLGACQPPRLRTSLSHLLNFLFINE